MITVTPNSAQAFPGAKVQFHAVVGNSPNSGVNWLVNGMSPGNADVGLIDSTGLYVAPNTVPSSGTLMVTAVSQADSTKGASAILKLGGR
jgi:hypothetical protein